MRNLTISIATTIVLALAMGSASAQTFPAKPIRILIGFPGGGAEISARLVGNEMAARLGQPVIVEAMPGAFGTIAANAVVKASPDGYTLLYTVSTIISSIFNKNNAVAAGTSLTPISNIMSSPYLLLGSAKSKAQANSLQELIAWSKANPGKLNHGSTGTSDIVAAMLKARTGLDFVNVPYKGIAPLVPAMITGEADFAFVNLAGWAPHIQAGAVRPLFVAATRRFSLAPNVPTAVESGIRDFVFETTYGLWAPLRTPPDIVQKLNAIAVAAVKSPDVAGKLGSEALSAQADGSTPAELMRLYESEIKFWTEAARLANYQPQ